jgi:hypothetical protein
MPPIGDRDASLHRVAYEVGYLSCVLGCCLYGSNYSSMRTNGHTYIDLTGFFFLMGAFFISPNVIFVALDALIPSDSRPWSNGRI